MSYLASSIRLTTQSLTIALAAAKLKALLDAVIFHSVDDLQTQTRVLLDEPRL